MIEDKRLLKRILKFLFADHSFKLYFFYSVISIVRNRFWTGDDEYTSNVWRATKPICVGIVHDIQLNKEQHAS